ncbi:hypothetical protein M5689_024765 [Euphorbia peplus]|nr:hypothetical protein M5689_024765 [Euphorbia peplus]
MEDSSKQQQEKEGSTNILQKIYNSSNGCLCSLVQAMLKCLGFDDSVNHHSSSDPSTENDPLLRRAPPRPPVSGGQGPGINSGGSI